MIFAKTKNEDIPAFRPRIVDEGLFRQERDGWRKWHEEQTAAERNLMGPVETHD
jgi:hypothetical protein